MAEYTTGKLPIRPKKVDPGLPTKGTGKYEWKGYLSKNGHPHGTDPKDGTMTNWNQVVSKGFGSADDEWGRAGSAERVDLLNKNLARLKQNGKWTMAQVTSAMNAAATQDVRAIDTVPLLAKLLQGTQAPNARDAQMLQLMIDWSNDGGSRLDLDNNGEIDAPGAAVMDGSWTNIANAFMKPRIGSQLERAEQPVLPLRQAAGRPVLGLVSVLRPGHQHAARQEDSDPVQERLLRQGRPAEVPGRHLGSDRHVR